ncbi:uncharacterized protein LOC111126069 isoform X3 [Crassostrea virginica]
MTCKTQDFSQQVSILCNRTSVGLCGGLGCTTDMYQPSGTNTTYYGITSLSYGTHLCNWSCSYGSTLSLEVPVVIYSDYLGVPNISSDPLPGEMKIKKVQLESTADCFYPANPSVSVHYSYQKDNGFQTLKDQAVSEGSSFIPGACSSDVEKRITVTSEVSGEREEMRGKTVYFKMILLQYAGDKSPKKTIALGPFSFEDCAFSPGGFLSVFLIEFAAFMIVMILLLMLKKIGGFSKLKVVVSHVYLIIALIIGIILGIVLCNKINLSIGLGIGLGCLLAVAHIVTVYIIHKKCDKDTKKDDDERRGTPTSTSKIEVTTK